MHGCTFKFGAILTEMTMLKKNMYLIFWDRRINVISPFFKLAGWPKRAIIARGGQRVPKDLVAISLLESASHS